MKSCSPLFGGSQLSHISPSLVVLTLAPRRSKPPPTVVHADYASSSSGSATAAAAQPRRHGVVTPCAPGAGGRSSARKPVHIMTLPNILHAWSPTIQYLGT